MAKGIKPVGTLIAAASAATVPISDGALAKDIAPAPTGTTVSLEGGVAFSNYWTTTFPGSPASLLPPLTTPDKIGAPPVSSAPLESKHNLGGYGSFSLGRSINPTDDWRFSASLYDFGATSSTASATQDVTSTIAGPFTNIATITETDRFSFAFADFDFGRSWSQAGAQFRAFAGLRALHTFDRFQVIKTTDKVGGGFLERDTLGASSQFTGVGPRIGLDVSTGSTFGLVGSVSAALIGGLRDATVDETGNSTQHLSNLTADWVGNLSGMVGASWQFTPGGQLVLGYRVDQWFNIRDSFAFAGFNNQKDVLVQTPFLKVMMRY